VELATARLFTREVDLEPESLEDRHGRLADVRRQGVDEARGEERHARRS